MRFTRKTVLLAALSLGGYTAAAAGQIYRVKNPAEITTTHFTPPIVVGMHQGE